MHTLSSLLAGELAGITRLDLSCGLTEFPEEIFTLADTLEILNLTGNALSRLPDDLPRLHKLKVIFCSDNGFTELPAVLGQCANLEMVGFKANQICHVPAAALPEKLRWLILTDNQLTALPAELGRCTRLQKLMLSGNQLTELPDEMAACTHLELIRLAANRFETLPAWLSALPRLSWLAYSGNPCSDVHEAAAMAQLTLPQIAWHALAIQHVLGEGASGIIYRAEWVTTAVAVKVFKGDVTSDGLPHSEQAACSVAGAHSGLIPLLGKVSDHPDHTAGLVMALIPPQFVNFAQPPSLASCTRDCYPADTRFTLPAAIQLARCIADAVAHLHAQGVMHGDLYGHNILWDEQGEGLLGDFGAASFLPRDENSPALQRLEVRAFGCLLEELLDRCDAIHDENFTALRALQNRCTQTKVEHRPLFDEILVELTHLRGGC
ncbi:MAG: leucine-rich repeat-containing protein kinase family protein [Gallionella sp.]|nr:leucine-rich repeat-containing protein kinase family protein [Gallionella sp.]MDD4959924.1 leucine-rich repeat-containing protein kinase family protein [Gallionella sp.]